jgi:hypothetical protein
LKAVGRTIRSEIISIQNKEELLEWWKELTIVPAYKKGARTDCSNCKCISLLSSTYNILSSILLSMLTPYAEENTGDHPVNSDTTSQQLIIYSAWIKYLRKNGNLLKQCISHL